MAVTTKTITATINTDSVCLEVVGGAMVELYVALSRALDELSNIGQDALSILIAVVVNNFYPKNVDVITWIRT